MSLNPIKLSDDILNQYISYMKTTFYISDNEYRKQFEDVLDNQSSSIGKGPYIDVINSFKKGKSINQLIDENILSTEFRKLYINDNYSMLDRKLYYHQEEAIRKAENNKNLVVTTGTGSGKTMCFMLPIFNYIMKKVENNTLKPGVKALIIYPMNALVNDQLKELRKILMYYDKISFGIYTGDTVETEKEALKKYHSEYNGNNPLKNEYISREKMKEEPPDILITNYAMLEYMMIRPKENNFFYGKYANDWKYIVLDEAHTYSGATGIEVSMLLRRLYNIIKNDNLRFIITSATLGNGQKDDYKICNFAKNLCSDMEFSNDNIIRAKLQEINKVNHTKKYNMKIYSDLCKYIDENKKIDEYIKYFEVNNIYFDNIEEIKSSSKPINLLLYYFLLSDENYYNIKQRCEMRVSKANEIAKDLNYTECDIINFITVASKAQKDDSKIFDARYHMFIRTLEGAYVTLPPEKTLTLYKRKEYKKNNESFKCYKIGVCQYCGEIYMEGYIDTVNHKFIQEFNSDNKKVTGIKKQYLLSIDNNEDDDIDNDNNEKIETYELCGKCGSIQEYGIINNKLCNCDDKYKVKLKCYKNLSSDDIEKTHKCIKCGNINTNMSAIREFYIGKEATTAVLNTALYQDMYNDEASKNINPVTDKQFLMFSDSRQEAAYISSYVDFTYKNILRKSLLLKSLDDLYSDNRRIAINELVDKLSILFDNKDIFKSSYSIKEALKTVMYEFVNTDRNSLENLGLIRFCYNIDLNDKDKIIKFNERECDTKTLFSVLLNSFRRNAIVEYINEYQNTLNENDYKFFKYSSINYKMINEYCDKKNRKKGEICWQSSEAGYNSRVKYIANVFDLDVKNNENKNKINQFLSTMYDYCIKNGYITYDGKLKMENFYIQTLKKDKYDIYKCNKCGKISHYNINDICTSFNCDGKLEKVINIDEYKKSNHYINLYTKFKPLKMSIKEHTAQISKDDAKMYQNDFINKKINVLSCSTTFEMGVDLGNLEAVYMSNMPPSPANYIQRAGRAGRSIDSAAYALTQCKLSSHDLRYFNDPEKMIKGKIDAPQFDVNNERIIKRHINSALLASFWKRHEELFNNIDNLYSDNNYNILIDYLKNIPPEVYNYVNDFIPHIYGANFNLKKYINNELIEIINNDRLEYTSDIDSLEEESKKIYIEMEKNRKLRKYL